MWDIVGRGSVSTWHEAQGAGLCVEPQTLQPIHVGPECRNKSAYEVFIDHCIREKKKAPCLCRCQQ